MPSGERRMLDREADLVIEGLELWVLNYQYADAQDFYDANWLNVFVRVTAPGAIVEVQGAIVMTTELAFFADGLLLLDQILDGEAHLDCAEPNLSIDIARDRLGHIEVSISVTPDNLSQIHKFKFDSDQTNLKSWGRQCRSILQRFPVRGEALGRSR